MRDRFGRPTGQAYKKKGGLKGRVKVTIWVRGDIPVLVDSWYVVFVVFYLALIDTSRSEYCFT